MHAFTWLGIHENCALQAFDMAKRDASDLDDDDPTELDVRYKLNANAHNPQ